MNTKVILEAQFSEILNSFSGEAAKKSYIFDKKTLEKVESNLISEAIIIEKRQTYKTNALEDDLIIRLTKQSARALGLTILSSLFFKKPRWTLIDLENKTSDVHEIHLINAYVEEHPIGLTLDHYNYQPKLPQEFSYFLWEAMNPSLSNDLSFNLVNSDGEVDDFKNKNTLFLQGSLGGMLILCEYLFNLSLEKAVTNYLNFEFNPSDACDIPVSNLSCHGRIEILHKIG